MTVLLFISTIVLFLTIDYFVQRKKKTVPVLQTVRPRTSTFRVPAGIFFTRSHTWLSLFPSGKVQLGIDDFLARMFNRPSIAMLKNNGETVLKGDPILRLDEGKNTVVVRSPIEGTIESINSKLTKDSSAINDALFSEGWAYTIQPSNANDLRSFYLGDNTKVWLKEEMGRLRDFFAHLSTPVPAFMQDGGELSRGVLNNLTTDECRKFENEFLRVE
jgi:glycine cleavage system H protein